MKYKLLAALMMCSAAPGLAWADYPERPITIVVPYAPGGTADGFARLVAEGLSAEMNANFIVESKPGASGMIAQSYVARAKPDGYTILYDATPLSINPAIHKAQFEVKRDFTPLSLVSVMPMVLVTAANSPLSSVKEVTEAAKVAPQQLTFASGGIGTVQFMAGELFNQGFGLDMLHIPYKSGGPAILAEMSGEVDMGFNNVSSVMQHIEAGKFKTLAVTAGERLEALPDVPTVKELGLEDYELYEWNGMLAPKDTPPEIIEKLEKAIQTVLKQPEIADRFTAVGAKVVASTSAEFEDYLDAEVARWQSVVESAGLTPQ